MPSDDELDRTIVEESGSVNPGSRPPASRQSGNVEGQLSLARELEIAGQLANSNSGDSAVGHQSDIAKDEQRAASEKRRLDALIENLEKQKRVLILQREVHEQRLANAALERDRLAVESEIVSLRKLVAESTNPQPPMHDVEAAIQTSTSTSNDAVQHASSSNPQPQSSELVRARLQEPTANAASNQVQSTASSDFAGFSRCDIMPAFESDNPLDLSSSGENRIYSARPPPAHSASLPNSLAPSIVDEIRSNAANIFQSTESATRPAGSNYVFVSQGNQGREEYAQMIPADNATNPQSQPTYLGAAAPNASSQMTAARTLTTPRSQTVSRASETRRTHELPPFNGRAEDWPAFESDFYATTEAFEYSELENLLRLRRSLNGEARKAVECMLIYPRHVNQVMQALKTRFGRPEQLVRSQINLARNLPSVSEAHLEQLGPFSLTVNNLATYLDSDSTRHYLADPTLLDELVAKLPMSRRLDWAGTASRILPCPTIMDFSRWICETARLINLVSQPATSRTTAANTELTLNRKPFTRNKHVLLNRVQEPTSTNNTEMRTNTTSTETSTIQVCPTFARMSSAERKREVAKRPLCFCCLSPEHLLPACTSKRQCGVNGCEKWHNELLHPQNSTSGTSKEEPMRQQASPTVSQQKRRNQHGSRRKQNQATATASSNAADDRQDAGTNQQSNRQVSTILNCRESEAKQTLLFRVVPVVLYGPTRKLETYALLDEGSSVTLLDEEVAEFLQLGGEPTRLNLQWFGNKSSAERSSNVTIRISGRKEGDERYELHNVRTIRDLELPTQSITRERIQKENPHLKEVPIPSYQQAKPKILIGLDNHHLGIPQDIRTNAEQEGIIATKTKLGWVVYGSEGDTTQPSVTILHINTKEDERYAELSELVRAHFSTEDFGVKIPKAAIESDEVIRARGLLAATSRRVGDRFETGLLWRSDSVILPDSRPMALQRLRGIETKMRRDPGFARLYRAQIDAFIQKGYARILTSEEAERRTNKTWYLPHFATQNVNKPGKIRLVFDAAAAVRGVCLNSSLLSGPDINIPLLRILFQFRLGQVGVCADIEEMFLQVRIRKEDQDAQRFLWRDGDTSAEPKTFVMQVMTFGATCSPTSAQFVKNLNAAEFEEEMPDAADAIRKHHYVDDYVGSFSSAEEAIRVTTDVVNVHRRGGFVLRDIVSNSKEVHQRLGCPAGQKTVPLGADEATQKILGMSWDTSDDTFRFLTRFARVHPDIVDGTRRPTKREVLSVAMSIFDPFGLLANFTLIAKVILQDLWRSDIGWDEPIPIHLDERWQTWRRQIERTQLVRVPRCYSQHILTSTDIELHVFADASEAAFAAVAYWRVTNNGSVQLAFVAGKARCAPLKLLSIPRLELQAAVLATRLLVEIRDSHEIQISKTFMWTDSETVLKWIRTDHRRYKPFVAFRVAEIVENAPASFWRWVPTALNVADDATRNKPNSRFDPNSRWLLGPAWLREDLTWPIQVDAPTHQTEDDIEVRKNFVGLTSSHSTIKFSRFSNFYRLARTIAWVRRFLRNYTSKPGSRTGGELRSTEVTDAIEQICRIVQREAFAKEIAILKSGKPIERGSPLFLSKPYLDEIGIMRVHGRTDGAKEEYLGSDAKRPILLPHDHHFTRLLVKHLHEQHAHQLVDATMAAVRVKYWVPRLRSLVRQIGHACNACRVRKALPTVPIQGQLPPDRLEAYVRPFTSTGLDFFGPIEVTIGRRREKRWVALFTCLTIRAVHLEIASNLSTDACLLCLRNFCNLRGVPSIIRCDNGTNFVGAYNETKHNSNFFNSEDIQKYLTTRGVEWRFNCPGNPEAGGAWERLVQSVKRVLRVTLLEDAPQVETLRALLLEAANIVNSRPLTHLEVEPGDPEPLTPNHFLLGGPNVAIVPNPADVEPRATRKQWQISRGLSRRFWQHWVRDYLPELTMRSKHYAPQSPLLVGDLVFVCDPNMPRGRWRRGRVSEVVSGPDGVARTATINTADGELRRPITKLARLRVESVLTADDVRGGECRNLTALSSSSKKLAAHVT